MNKLTNYILIILLLFGFSCKDKDKLSNPKPSEPDEYNFRIAFRVERENENSAVLNRIQQDDYVIEIDGLETGIPYLKDSINILDEVEVTTLDKILHITLKPIFEKEIYDSVQIECNEDISYKDSLTQFINIENKDWDVITLKDSLLVEDETPLVFKDTAQPEPDSLSLENEQYIIFAKNSLDKIYLKYNSIFGVLSDTISIVGNKRHQSDLEPIFDPNWIYNAEVSIPNQAKNSFKIINQNNKAANIKPTGEFGQLLKDFKYDIEFDTGVETPFLNIYIIEFLNDNNSNKKRIDVYYTQEGDVQGYLIDNTENFDSWEQVLNSYGEWYVNPNYIEFPLRTNLILRLGDTRYRGKDESIIRKYKWE
ncbi:hypothetical protein [Sediminitomix flava]|uniref:Uncharacterized protein n=1 Tax=Sediminitomix flava TaxID=379075 RepID=A0A315Z5L0_SEDFL|nr:hypothetical protein [Sediminitomix flava]PWJ38489.1 hypothetical protein BC781_10779 [Sediminitomix flava]